jgi:hypothetical protein
MSLTMNLITGVITACAAEAEAHETLGATMDSHAPWPVASFIRLFSMRQQSRGDGKSDLRHTTSRENSGFEASNDA